MCLYYTYITFTLTHPSTLILLPLLIHLLSQPYYLFLNCAALAWHPIHEGLLASGAGDGAIMFWSAQHERSLGQLLGAHEGLVLSLDWHPLGHSLASGSLDTTVKFWIRQRPADSGLDPHILGQRAAEAMGIKAAEPVISVADDEMGSGGGIGEEASIPGMRSRRGGFGGNRDSRDGRDGFGSRDTRPDYYSRSDYSRSESRSESRPEYSRSSYSSNHQRDNRPPPPPPPPRH